MTNAKHDPHMLTFPALGRCVGDVEQFASDTWGQRAMVRRAAGSFRDLRPSLRMVRDGEAIPIGSYTKSVRLGGVWTTDVADPPAITHQFHTGATLILQSLDRTHRPLVQFCRALEEEISHPVQANAYLSPPHSAGLLPHADTHDVLLLQVEGGKRWTVAGVGAVDLVAGDVAYIPRGCRHSAATNASYSLHLTIGITAVTFRDVAQRAFACAPHLDSPLALGFSRRPSDEQELMVEDALAAAIAGLLACDVHEVTVAEQRRARQIGRTLGSLSTHLMLETLTDQSRLARRPGATVRLDDDRVTVVLPDREVRMPLTVRRAIDSIFSCDTLTVSELAGLDGPGRLVLARRLIREGALEIRSPVTS